MAYQGTTAGSSLANPPRQVVTGMWNIRSTNVLTSTAIAGQQLWMYNTTDGTTELISATYFTDGERLGMREGDIIFGSIDTGTSKHMYLGVISTVTTAGCGISSTNGYISSTR